jgi:hypothetical protein
MISFKQRHFIQAMILMLVRWYVAYPMSYRDIEELAAERGLKVGIRNHQSLGHSLCAAVGGIFSQTL